MILVKRKLEHIFLDTSKFPKSEVYYMTDSMRFYEAEQHMERALSLSFQGKNTEAIEAIDKALECDPKFAEAYNKKGDFLFKLGRIKEALDCYLKSKDNNPNIQNNYYDLGRTYLMLGEYDNSLENFNIANKMKPQTDIHAFLGKIFFEQGNYDDALKSFEVVLQEDEFQTMSVYYSAIILLQKGEITRANNYFNKIIEKYARLVRSRPNFAEGYYYIGKAYFYMEDYEKAEENLILANKYDTEEISNHYSFDMFYSDAEAFAALAEAQSKLGKTDEAKQNILKALALEPNNKKLLDLKAKLGY